MSIGQKGSLRVDIRATGRAAHSAYPEEGASAIAALLDTIDRIRRLPLPIDSLLGDSTLNVGLIDGGVAPNVLAPEASAQILIRTVEPTERLKETIRGLAAPGVTIEFPVELPFHKAAGAPAGWETTVVSYASDLPFLAHVGRVLPARPGIDQGRAHRRRAHPQGRSAPRGGPVRPTRR